MIRTLIVDDDSLVHATLRSLINWEQYGYALEPGCANGNQALSYLQNHSIDLLITDIKMPGMGGLELITNLRERNCLPVTIVLSGYDEYELVREAFLLGAYDYQLKANINKVWLEHLLTRLRKTVFKSLCASGENTARKAENAGPLPDGKYCVVTFLVSNFEEAASRFGGDLQESLQKPMLELVRQIHRIQGRASIRAVNPAHYELYYPVRDNSSSHDTVISVAGQIQSVWNDFINIRVSAGISESVPAADIPKASAESLILCQMSRLQGSGQIFTSWQHGKLLKGYARNSEQFEGLISAFMEGDREREHRMGLFFSQLHEMDHEECISLIMQFLTCLTERMQNYGFPYFQIYPEGRNVPSILSELQSKQECELWLRNTLRSIEELISRRLSAKQPGAIEKAKLFMQDNFNQCELSLKAVADYVGFNEKYFSTRFTKECGFTFVAYLNELRINRAQELLLQTDLKMYEISEAVGYNSVEHFNHMFKKKLGISPKEYRNTGK